MKKLLTLVLLYSLTLVPSPAESTTWYTGTGGNNSNTCTQAQTVLTRKLTVAAGLACMAAAGGSGHRLEITAGTYNETNLTLTSGTVSNYNVITNFGSDQVNFTNTGSVAVGTFALNSGLQYINIVGSCTPGTGRTCTMDFDKSPMAFEKASLGGSQFITLDGIRIHNVVVGGSISSGVAANIAADNITFKNCRIDHNGTTPDGAGQAGYAFYIGGNNNIIENCELDNHGGYGIHQYSGDQTPSNNIYRFNLIHDNGQLVTGNVADGILMSGVGTPSNNHAYGNIIWNNARGYGIRLHPCTNCSVYNNTIYNNGGANGAVGIAVWSGSGAQIKNNIISANTFGNMEYTASGATFSFNLCGPGACSFGTNNITESAATTFTTPGSDFTLKAGSSAINGGTALGSGPPAFNVALNSVARPQGAAWDIGAYESVTGVVVPVVTITQPVGCTGTSTACTTTSSTITVSGTSNQVGGTVTWVCDRCTPSPGSTITGTINNWTLSPALTLKAGINILEVRGTSGAGGIGNDTITVTYAPPHPGNALVAAFGFEEGSGTVATDSSGAGNNGTLIGGTSRQAEGRFGQGLLFNGTTHYVSVPDSNTLDLTQSFTLAAWVKATNTASANFAPIVIKNGEPAGAPYLLYASIAGSCGDGHIAGYVKSNGISGPTFQACDPGSPLQVGIWTHMAVTYDNAAGNIKLYKNGVLVATTLAGGYMEASTLSLDIGHSEFGEFFGGMIDEVRVYNFALPLAGALNATPNTACSASEQTALGTASVIGTMNCPVIPLAAPLAFKVSASSTIKLGADKTQKIGQVPQ